MWFKLSPQIYTKYGVSVKATAKKYRNHTPYRVSLSF